MESAGLTTSQLVSRFVGTCVIFIVSIMKLPQIYAVFKEKSSKGLDLRSLLIEVIGCTIYAAYASINRLPVTAYGEVYFLIVQDFILLWTIFYYNGMFGVDVIVPHLLYISFIVMVGMGYITTNIAQTLLLLTMPSPYIAMTLQIMTIRADKSSGTLAPLSFFFGLFTMMARVFTTAVETDDKTLLYNAICLVAMNIILIYYVLSYREEKVKKKD